MMPDFIVSFDGPEADGIRLTTEPGIAVGDGLEAIDALPSPAEPTCVGPAVDPVDARNAENADMRVGVVLSDVIVDEAAHTATQVEYIAAVIAPVVIGPGCV